jgi:hypothetical protein
MNIPSKQYRHLIECLESQRFCQYFNTSEMFIHLKKALSSSFPALYNEYTVYKIISILDWMPIMDNINLYVAQILKDLLIFTSKILIYLKTTLCRSFEALSRHRSTAWQRICAAKEKNRVFQGKDPLHNMRSECSKIYKNYNNDNDSSKFLWTWQKA